MDPPVVNSMSVRGTVRPDPTGTVDTMSEDCANACGIRELVGLPVPLVERLDVVVPLTVEELVGLEVPLAELVRLGVEEGVRVHIGVWVDVCVIVGV